MTSRLVRAPIVITIFPECCRKPRQNQFKCNQFFFRTRQAAISSTFQGWELAASCDLSNTEHQPHRQISGGPNHFHLSQLLVDCTCLNFVLNSLSSDYKTIWLLNSLSSPSSLRPLLPSPSRSPQTRPSGTGYRHGFPSIRLLSTQSQASQSPSLPVALCTTAQTRCVSPTITNTRGLQRFPTSRT